MQLFSMDRSGTITLVILILTLTVVFLYYAQVRQANQEAQRANTPAATVLSNNSRYTDIDGNPVLLGDYVGQKVVALAWASWCPSCADQLQIMGELVESNPDVVVLAFNRAEPVTTANQFLQFYGLSSQVELVLDPDDHFFQSIGGYSMPETVIFDESGQILHHKRGFISVDELTLLLETQE
jgi:thiol-disulfide isomerase/thioredoxin